MDVPSTQGWTLDEGWPAIATGLGAHDMAGPQASQVIGVGTKAALPSATDMQVYHQATNSARSPAPLVAGELPDGVRTWRWL